MTDTNCLVAGKPWFRVKREQVNVRSFASLSSLSISYLCSYGSRPREGPIKDGEMPAKTTS